MYTLTEWGRGFMYGALVGGALMFALWLAAIMLTVAGFEATNREEE